MALINPGRNFPGGSFVNQRMSGNIILLESTASNAEESVRKEHLK